MELEQRLSVGLELIDDHHRELLSRVGQLALALRRGNVGEVKNLIGFLRSYVVEHFATEEREMKASHYPRYAAHRAAHEQFAGVFHHLEHQYQTEGCSQALADRVQKTMTGWLEDHILKMDHDLADHLLGQQKTQPAVKSAARPPTRH